jgi:hypothetical protein
MGQMCVMGACRIDCPLPNTRCTVGAMMSCVNTDTDLANCGACGTACPPAANAAAACAMGTCGLGACNAGFGNCDMNAANGCETNTTNSVTNCGACGMACAAPANAAAACAAGTCGLGACNTGFGNCDMNAANGCETNTTNSVAHCGACGMACATPANGTAACAMGACRIAACNAGFADCDMNATNGCEANTQTSNSNCGACGRVCSAGQTCTAGVCSATALGGTVYQVAALQTAGCSLLEHNGVTGDDRGGIAISSTQLFYSGDNATGRFSPADLTGGTGVGGGHDALFSDLASEQVYAFGTAAGPFRGTFGGTTVTIDRFFALNGATGATGAATMLSSTFTITDTPGISSQGYFSGMGRVVVLTGGRALDIALPSGAVVDRGAFTFPAHTTCENSAVWGVAEFFGGALYVDFVQNTTTIARVPVAGGGTAGVVGTFTSLSDMCSFTVSPNRNRWYWHHEGGSQFGGSDESIGFCPMTLRTCREALMAGRTADGVYMLDPDGSGPLPTHSVYCDQTTDGGGWALVGRIGDPRYLPQLDRNLGAITAPGGMGNALHTSFANITGNSVRVGRQVGVGTNTGNFFQINDCTAGDAACWFGRFMAQNDGDTYGAWLTAGGAWGNVPAGCTNDQCPTQMGERDQSLPQRIAIFGGDCHSTCNTDGDDTRNGFTYRDYGSAAMPSRVGNRAWWGSGTVTSGSTALGVEIPNVDYGQTGTQYRDLWIR